MMKKTPKSVTDAISRYREKLAKKGYKQRNIYATDEQMEVLKMILDCLKKIENFHPEGLEVGSDFLSFTIINREKYGGE